MSPSVRPFFLENPGRAPSLEDSALTALPRRPLDPDAVRSNAAYLLFYSRDVSRHQHLPFGGCRDLPDAAPC